MSWSAPFQVNKPLRCHLKSTYGLVNTANPAAEHIHTGPKHIHTSTIVGKVRHHIIHIRRADSANRRLRRGRVVLGIISAVPRSNRKEHPGRNRRRGRAINRIRLATTKTHVCDGALGAPAGRGAVLGVGGDEVDARQHGRDGAGAVGVEDLDRVELGLLGHAVGGPADGAGDVGAVAGAVGVGGVDEVGEPGGAALELLGGVSWVGMMGVVGSGGEERKDGRGRKGTAKGGGGKGK